MYPPEMVAPMKADLTEAGFSELITEADVDTALAKEGTTLVVLNSVCGCAAGSMRPGVKLAVKHSKVPTNLTTAFAGVDREAVDRARKFSALIVFWRLSGSFRSTRIGCVALMAAPSNGAWACSLAHTAANNDRPTK